MPNLSTSNKVNRGLEPVSEHRAAPRRQRCPLLFPLQYKNRPPLVRSAIRLAAEEGIKAGLPASCISVLQALISCGFNQDNPGQSIFAKKATLAKLARVGEATVYRALNKLREQGLICRSAQDRHGDGKMDLSLISLSSSFLHLIKSTYVQVFKQASQEKGQNQDSANPDAIEKPASSQCSKNTSGDTISDQVIDGLIDGPYIEVNGRCTESTSVCNQSTGSGIEEIVWSGRKFRLPVGLAWLCKEKKMQPTGVIKLMTLNTKINGRKDLELLVELRRNTIAQLNSVNACYRYIEKLINSSIDAASALLRERKKAVAEAKRQEKAAEVAACLSWASSRAGLIYVSRAGGTKTFEVTASGRIIVGDSGNPGSSPTQVLNRSFIQAVESGGLTLYRRPVIEKGGANVLAKISNVLSALKKSGADKYGVCYGR